MKWTFPLLGPTRWPDAPGQFGARRRYDIHTGVDLYCDEGTTCVAAEDGQVCLIEDFTGPAAGTPWWNATKGVYIEGESGVLVYGEIDSLWVHEGKKVKAGDPIGLVKRVLMDDKGRPTSMLHFEQHTEGMYSHNAWTSVRPVGLLDPTYNLKNAWQRSGVCAGYAQVTNLEVKVREVDGLETWLAAPMHPGWSHEAEMSAEIALYVEHCQNQLRRNGFLLNECLAQIYATEILGVRQRVR